MASIRKQTEYVLMSKDTAVLSFLCKRNEFDEPNFREVACHADYRPILSATIREYCFIPTSLPQVAVSFDDYQISTQ